MSLGKRTKTEHSGAKNGGGYWGTREEAKEKSNKIRRQHDKKIVKNENQNPSKEDTSKGC